MLQHALNTIPVRIEECYSSTSLDVLLKQDAKKGRLPRPGLSDDVDVRAAVGLSDAERPEFGAVIRQRDHGGSVVHKDSLDSGSTYDKTAYPAADTP